mgnify:CR=1 FL=1
MSRIIISILLFILIQSHSIVHAEIFKLKDCYEYETMIMKSNKWTKFYDYEKFTDQDELEEYIFLVDTDKDMVLRYQQYTNKSVSETQDYYNNICEDELLLCDSIAEKISKKNYYISSFKNNIVETVRAGIMNTTFFINIKDGTVEILHTVGSSGSRFQCEVE